MSGYGSLFERLGGTTQTRAGDKREVAVMSSVAGHLARMLSVRAGSVQMLPDYGLPDINDMRLSLHDALAQSRKAIELFIENYEPRLRQVQVLPVAGGGDPFRLAFSIRGLLDIEGIRRPVSFCAKLDGSGQVAVSELHCAISESQAEY